ncbi:hypothetical protein PAXRUDRAFT_57073, partial [Paxillus rubicundulus Ve08.2h10]
KSVFIGYPQGYKGWKFYNPTTKRTIISEHADFNECYFLATGKPPNNPGALLPPPVPPADTGYHPPHISDDGEPESLQVPAPGGENGLPAAPLGPAVHPDVPVPLEDKPGVLDQNPAP